MILSSLAVLLLALPGGVRAARPSSSAAGSVVRSKEWIVRRGASRQEEFVGEVRYDASSAHFSSDWALFRQESRDWRARGNVVLRKDLKDGDVVTARGEAVRYNEITRAGTLEPAPGARVEFARAPADAEPDRGEGARLDWEGESWAALGGGVRVWGPRLQAWADSARYELAAKKLLLRGGRPVARKVDGDGGWTTALKADEIDAPSSPRRIEARGGVKGWLVFKGEKKLTEKAK